LKSPYLTKNVETFLSNPNLPDDWKAFRSSIVARMTMFPDAAYAEEVIFEVVRYYMSLAQIRKIESEVSDVAARAREARRRD
jgi:hypothetical protein